MDGYKLVIFTGGSGENPQQYYRAFGYVCDINQPASCVMILTDIQATRILPEHEDWFTVRSGWPWIGNGASLAGEYS